MPRRGLRLVDGGLDGGAVVGLAVAPGAEFGRRKIDGLGVVQARRDDGDGVRACGRQCGHERKSQEIVHCP